MEIRDGYYILAIIFMVGGIIGVYFRSIGKIDLVEQDLRNHKENHQKLEDRFSLHEDKVEDKLERIDQKIDDRHNTLLEKIDQMLGLIIDKK